MDCEKIERLYTDLQRVMGNEVLDDEFFEDIYRELTRVLGGMVPDWVKVNKDLLEVLKDHVGKFDRCEFVHIVLSPSHFHPCESGEILLKELFEFLDGCEEVYFYPLEDTLHLAVLFGERAVSFPSEGSQAGYAIQLAGMCGVRIEKKDGGRCAVAAGDVGKSVAGNFDRVAFLGRVEMSRRDLEKVLKLGEDSLEDVALFFKPAGRYEELLNRHPMFYDLILELAVSPEELNGKVPLGEMVEIERVKRKRFVEERVVVFDGCEARLAEGEFVEKGWTVLRGRKLKVAEIILNTRVARKLLRSVPLESLPIPSNLSEEEAIRISEKILDMERKMLKI